MVGKMQESINEQNVKIVGWWCKIMNKKLTVSEIVFTGYESSRTKVGTNKK